MKKLFTKVCFGFEIVHFSPFLEHFAVLVFVLNQSLHAFHRLVNALLPLLVAFVVYLTVLQQRFEVVRPKDAESFEHIFAFYGKYFGHALSFSSVQKRLPFVYEDDLFANPIFYGARPQKILLAFMRGVLPLQIPLCW